MLHVFRFIVAVETLDPNVLTTPPCFGFRLRRQGCGKRRIKVDAGGRFSRVRRLAGPSPERRKDAHRTAPERSLLSTCSETGKSRETVKSVVDPNWAACSNLSARSTSSGQANH